jgi:hypothetical protein
MMMARTQAVTGVTPPSVGEAVIRETWPSVASAPGLASLGRLLTGTIILAPLAWLLMAPIYFGKLLPFIACRYTLTNRRLMIRRGWRKKPTHQIELADIDDVRVVKDANSDFFRAATIELYSQSRVALKLPGTPEPEAFANAVINACRAWAPGKMQAPFISAAT